MHRHPQQIYMPMNNIMSPANSQYKATNSLISTTCPVIDDKTKLELEAMVHYYENDFGR